MLGLGISVPKKGGIFDNLSELSKRYLARVKAEGGTIESKSCLEKDYSKYNWKYYFRVINQGGTVESLECVKF